jgi:transcriptional regulator with XRE-family HTH domain
LTHSRRQQLDAQDDIGPSVQSRRQLGRQLRRLREQAGITQEDAARAGEVSTSTLGRIESGRSPCKAMLATALAGYYRADPATVAALAELARESKAQPWWAAASRLIPESLRPFIGLEADASGIHWYEASLVPALVQTRDYAEALIRHALPEADDAEVTQRVELRIHRQAMLTRPIGAPTLRVLLDDGAVRRPLGPAGVMVAQREHLLRVSLLPNVEVRILPLDAVHYGLHSGPFVLLDFRDDIDEPSTVYVDGLVGGWFHDKRSDVARFRAAFDQMWNAAKPVR